MDEGRKQDTVENKNSPPKQPSLPYSEKKEAQTPPPPILTTNPKERLKHEDPAAKDKMTFSFSWMAIVVRGIVGTCISIFIFTQIHRIEDEDSMARFLALSNMNEMLMTRDIENLTDNLKVAGLLSADSEKITEEEFTEFGTLMTRHLGFVKSVSWIPMQAIENNSPSAQALQSKKPTAIIKIPEKTKNEQNNATIAYYVPIFREEQGLGVVKAIINIRALTEENIYYPNPSAYDAYIYSNDKGSGNRLLYYYNAENNADKTAPDTEDQLKLNQFTNVRTVIIGDQKLTVITNATDSFTEYSWQAAFASSISMLITSFIVVTAWILLEIEKRQFSNVLHQEHEYEMEDTIDQLETAQNRLVAQENLAALGGLTAGIAHEIKNPLNFINNFSTLSVELIDQIDHFLKHHKSIGSEDEREEVCEAMTLLKNNIDTIHEQGKRADSTIQRMLAHSRGKPGEWSVTNIHKLIEEYINFSYHGMRAKNTGFNAKIVKDFDPSIEKIECVVNDLSRVFLNLFNNAFQSVDDKKKQLGDIYSDPTLTVSTQNVGNYLRIRIRDNGLGINEENKAKIFTPFFTTKPTGIGTGLGLSLSYNIVVREHGGSITFDTVEGEYCEFIITLPLHVKKQKEAMTNENHGR